MRIYHEMKCESFVLPIFYLYGEYCSEGGIKSMPEQQFKEILERLNSIERKEDDLRRVREVLDKAAVLNGGFDKVMLKLDHITEKQEETADKVNKIHDTLYEPDKGFFARVKSIEMTTEAIKNKVNEHEEKGEALVKKVEQDETKLTTHEQTTEKLKKLAGEDLQDLASVMKLRKTFDKLFWLVVTGVGTMIGKIIWDIYTHVGPSVGH